MSKTSTSGRDGAVLSATIVLVSRPTELNWSPPPDIPAELPAIVESVMRHRLRPPMLWKTPPPIPIGAVLPVIVERSIVSGSIGHRDRRLRLGAGRGVAADRRVAHGEAVDVGDTAAGPGGLLSRMTTPESDRAVRPRRCPLRRRRATPLAIVSPEMVIGCVGRPLDVENAELLVGVDREAIGARAR